MPASSDNERFDLVLFDKAERANAALPHAERIVRHMDALSPGTGIAFGVLSDAPAVTAERLAATFSAARPIPVLLAERLDAGTTTDIIAADLEDSIVVVAYGMEELPAPAASAIRWLRGVADAVAPGAGACRAAGHIVGSIRARLVRAPEWTRRSSTLDALIEDFNVRGQRQQVDHPGFAERFRFCPDCGAPLPLDPTA